MREPPSTSRAWPVRWWACALVGAALMIVTSTAQAAVTIGHTGGNSSSYCTSNSVLAQGFSATGWPSYRVPAGGGVITSWSMEGYNSSYVKLKVFRGNASSPLLVVGESGYRQLVPGSLNKFPLSPSIAVQAGDRLGLAMPAVVLGQMKCAESGVADGNSMAQGSGDTPVGGMQSFFLFTNLHRLNVAAEVEPDTDGDGLGDESENPCPGTTGAVCPSPTEVTPSDGTAPQIQNVFVKPSAFRVARGGGAAGKPRGTSLGYTLSEAATVTFVVERKSKGRLVKGKCVRRSRSNGKRKRCLRFNQVGSFTHEGTQGANEKPFSGRIGKRALIPAAYRVALVATDAVRNASKPARTHFTVLRQKKRKKRRR